MAFTLSRTQWLPREPGEVFPFFADAGNLQRITPPMLRFQIVTPQPIDMHAGTVIDYKLRVRGLPMRWRTLISTWDPPHRFVDEALRSPYRQWVHTHTFTPQMRNGVAGTRCDDEVVYAVPGGAIVNRLVVRRDVERIFDYRAKVLAEIFP